MAISRHATAALEALTRANFVVHRLVARVHRSKDDELKAGIIRLRDELVSLRDSIQKLSEEAAIRGLGQIVGAVKPRVCHVGRVNYYFRGEDGPYCPNCYERDRELRLLAAARVFAAGMGRDCQNCRTVYIEAV